MGLIDKVKGSIHETATAAREGIDEIQTRRELDTAYGDLGKRTVALIDAGTLAAPELEFDVARIGALKAELGEHPEQTA